MPPIAGPPKLPVTVCGHFRRTGEARLGEVQPVAHTTQQVQSSALPCRAASASPAFRTQKRSAALRKLGPSAGRWALSGVDRMSSRPSPPAEGAHLLLEPGRGQQSRGWEAAAGSKRCLGQGQGRPGRWAVGFPLPALLSSPSPLPPSFLLLSFPPSFLFFPRVNI